MLETKDAGPSVYLYKDALPTTQHDVKAKFNRLLANLDSIVEILSQLKKLTRN